jgi:hypothetical protein
MESENEGMSDENECCESFPIEGIEFDETIERGSRKKLYRE